MRYPVDFKTNRNGYWWMRQLPMGNFHPGIDLNIGSGDSDLGQPVYALSDCEIVHVGSHYGWGNLVVGYMPKHGTWFRLAHLQNVKCKEFDVIKEGEQIAELGKTGTKWAHVHFEIIVEKLPYWTKYTKFMPRGEVLRYWTHPLDYVKKIQDEEVHDSNIGQEEHPIITWNKENKLIEKWADNPSESDMQLGWLVKKLYDKLHEEIADLDEEVAELVLGGDL